MAHVRQVKGSRELDRSTVQRSVDALLSDRRLRLSEHVEAKLLEEPRFQPARSAFGRVRVATRLVTDAELTVLR